MNQHKFIELQCVHCQRLFLKERKEHKRRIKTGTLKFYCGLSCSAKANEALAANAKYNKDNPQEARLKLIQSPNFSLRTKDELSPFRFLLNHCKAKCKKSPHKTVSLSAQDLKDIWDKQVGKCPYTGFSMQIPHYNRAIRASKTTPYLASLDRIDSSKGYVLDNVEFVCLAVNYAKNAFSREEMLNFFKKLN